MFADVYYFDEWNSWAVTLYDNDGHRARDEHGDEIEAMWSAYRGQAVTEAEGLLQRGEISRYDVYTRDGRLARSASRTPVRGIEEARYV